MPTSLTHPSVVTAPSRQALGGHLELTPLEEP